MKGYFGVESPVTVDSAQKKGEAQENTGVAAVVPAQKILDILQSPRAKAYIDRLVAETYIARGDLKGADELYRGLITRLAAYDPEDADLKGAKLGYAALLEKMGRHGDAVIQLGEAMKIRRSAPVPDDDKK
jgi:tetratricopeptide (TPR) repeat protein